MTSTAEDEKQFVFVFPPPTATRVILFTFSAVFLADAVTLGVDAPPFEVQVGPLGDDAGTAGTGELAHVVEGFPRVLFELESLGALGFGFFDFRSLAHFVLLALIGTAENRKPATA